MEQQQHQWSQMANESPQVLIPNISSEQIQKCLEENTQLILFILESKRLGRPQDCERHTTKLQNNLTFLSNLADVMAQPPPPPPPPPKPMPPQVLGVGPTRQQGHWSAAPRQIQLNDEENRIQFQQQQQGYYLQQQQQQFMGFGGINNNTNNNNNNSFVFDHQGGGGTSDSTVATNFLGI